LCYYTLFMQKHKLFLIISRAAAICLTFAIVVFFLFIYPNQPLAKVFLYHSVTNQEVNDQPDIGVKLFERQLDYLSKHGYETVFLSTVAYKYNVEKKVPANWVVLTFDGGNEDFYTNVYPLLKKYKMKATLFVVTSLIGDAFVTWDQLKEMKASGLVEIGSHSQNHLAATCASLEEIKKDTIGSKAILEEHLGGKVLVYAYPFGAVNAQAEAVAKAAGYTGAVGIAYRLWEFKLNDVYNMHRIYVCEQARFPLMFRFMLSGYYVPTREFALRVLNIKTPRDAADCRPQTITHD